MEREETKADVNPFDATPANSSVCYPETGIEVPKLLLLNQFNMYYDMTGEKYLHIFNHYRYENNACYGGDAKALQRDGTHEDARSLENTFTALGFRITVHHDLSHQDILKEMRKLCFSDHNGTSCIAVAIMTHGHNGGVLLAADEPYQLKEVTDILQNGHPSLQGKPKLCFIQACRAGHLEEKQNAVLPTQPDTLFLCSSSPHYYSYRTSCGTWMMQSLCEVINQHHQLLDLLQMLTFINQAVASKETYCLDPRKSNKKQMPETNHTLTKLLKF